MNKLKNIFSNLICILNVLFFMLIWSNYDNFQVLSDLTIIIVAFMNIILFIFYLPDIINDKKILFIYIMISACILLFSALLNSSGMGSIILLIFTWCILLQFRYYKINKKVLLLIITSLFLYFIYFILFRDNRLNPNTLGYVIFLLGIYTCLFFEWSGLPKLIITIPLIIMITNILDTNSRGALLGSMVFIVLAYIISPKIWGRRYIYYTICIFITIGSIIFTIIYVQMWKSNIQFNIPFIQKSLYTGREYIWNEVLYLLSDSPLKGIGSKLELYSFVEFNVHNSMLNIMVTYGIPIFLSSIIIFIDIFRDIRKVLLENRIYKVSTAGLISIFVVGFFETNLMWLNVSYLSYFMVAIIFSLENNKNIISDKCRKNNNLSCIDYNGMSIKEEIKYD